MKPKIFFIIFMGTLLMRSVNLPCFAQEPLTEPEAAEAVIEGPSPPAAGVVAEQPSTGAAETAAEEPSKGAAGAVAEAPPAGTGEGARPGKVTLVFKDADIRTVLHTLSYKSGVNIVAAEDVEGKVSIRLIDVSWETALEVILKNHGLASERVGNIIRVITLESVTEEELQNEVFILNYSKAKDVMEAVKDTLTERGKVKYDERTNTIIVTDIPTNLHKVREVIKRLDRRTPQVAVEAKIIETTLDKDENLGIDWTLQVTARGAARPTTAPFRAWGSGQDMYPDPTETRAYDFEYMEDTTSWVANPNYDATASNPGDLWIHPQVLVHKGTVATDFSHHPAVSPFTPSELEGMEFSSFPMAAASRFTFGTLDFSQFSAVLQILRSRTDTKIISNPTIVTLNNTEAKVHVGHDYYIPKYTQNDTTGDWEVTGYEQRSIGVVLTVTPHINEAGDISVLLRPEVSAYSGTQSMGGGLNLPIFSVRNAEAQVMVRDGQTIAMGGLMKETATKYIKKVPILGDIPFLGELFKKTEDAVDTTDLLIFVTVRIVSEDRDDKALLEETEKKVVRADKDVKGF